MSEAEAVGPNVLEPVSVRSRLVRAQGVSYTEVDGTAVVWEPKARVLHELSPAAAALWAALDGRPLAALIEEARAARGASPVGDDPLPLDLEVIEAVRRLRALRLVGDLGGYEGQVAGLEPSGAPPLRVRIAADVVTKGEERLVVLRGDSVVELDVSRNAVFGPDGDDPLPIDRIVVVEADRSEPRSLTPVQLLGALRAACPDAEDEAFLLDALAAVAETVPGLGMDAQALARFST